MSVIVVGFGNLEAHLQVYDIRAELLELKLVDDDFIFEHDLSLASTVCQ